MATVTSSTTSVNQAASEDWITPREQFLRLTGMRELRGIALLKHLPVNIPAIIGQYLIDPKLTDWHTVLKHLKILPERIPRLPKNIHRILYSECPIYRETRKEDGAPYRVMDTHLLYLIPSGTLKELEARVRAYGQPLAEYKGNPHSIAYSLNCKEHVNTQFQEPKWVLLSEDLLPESCNKSYEEQMQIVAHSSRKAPSLRAVIGVALLHKVATGKCILSKGNEEYFIFSRVEESSCDYHLVAGSCSFASRLHIFISCNNASNIGIAGLAEIQDDKALEM